MAVTIRELAEAAGVSRGTVDRVLHNRGRVNAEVEARVRELAERMGYFPNRAGKALALSKKAIKLGCFLPGVGNPFFDDVKKGFTRAEEALSGYCVTLSVKEAHGFRANEHIAFMEELIGEGCGGLCVATVDSPSVRKFIDKTVERGIPVVAVNMDLSNTKRLCYVGSDYTESGRIAGGMAALCSKNSLEILIASGSYKVKGHNERVSGFKSALDERGAVYRIANIFETQDDDATAYAKTKRELAKNPEVNCIYISAAGVGGVCMAAEEAGFREKSDAMIACFDDVPETRRLISRGVIDFTVCQEPERQGYRAVRKLFDYFMEKKPPEDFYTELIVRVKENIGRNKDDAAAGSGGHTG